MQITRFRVEAVSWRTHRFSNSRREQSLTVISGGLYRFARNRTRAADAAITCVWKALARDWSDENELTKIFDSEGSWFFCRTKKRNELSNGLTSICRCWLQSQYAVICSTLIPLSGSIATGPPFQTAHFSQFTQRYRYSLELTGDLFVAKNLAVTLELCGLLSLTSNNNS